MQIYKPSGTPNYVEKLIQKAQLVYKIFTEKDTVVVFEKEMFVIDSKPSEIKRRLAAAHCFFTAKAIEMPRNEYRSLILNDFQKQPLCSN